LYPWLYLAPAKTLRLTPAACNFSHQTAIRRISFGHGIHAGIHWRSDTDTSIQLGEAVALSFLKDQAHTYIEHFSISLTKLDGTTETISNP
jgi:hypothetical protein